MAKVAQVSDAVHGPLVWVLLFFTVVFCASVCPFYRTTKRGSVFSTLALDSIYKEKKPCDDLRFCISKKMGENKR